MIEKLRVLIWDHLRFELIGAVAGICILFLRKLFNKQGEVKMDLIKKEFLEGVKLSAEIKDGELIVAASAKLASLVQLADDKIENQFISAALQGLKALVGKVN